MNDNVAGYFTLILISVLVGIGFVVGITIGIRVLNDSYLAPFLNEKGVFIDFRLTVSDFLLGIMMAFIWIFLPLIPTKD